MIAVAEAQALVLAGCVPLTPLSAAVLVDEVVGLVLAEDVVAAEPVPSFDNSAMDGYAVHAADTVGAPVTLNVVATILTGQHRTEPVERGQAVRIMTGAPVPSGVDAVCLVERTSSTDGGATVEIEIELTVGTAVRHRGDDVQVGTTVFEAGEQLTPAHLGVLATLGVPSVLVHPRVRVGVLSTGDELATNVPIGALRAGQIRDSNRPGLLALVAQHGFEPVDLGLVADDEEALRSAFLSAGERCDAVLTTGGVSVGDRDLVKEVLAQLAGDAMAWMQVAVKPAKPFAFGVLPSGVPVFGLPGNPVSSFVSFELFARPGLRRLAGHTEPMRPTLRGVAAGDYPRGADGKLHLVPSVAHVDPSGELRLHPSGSEGSHRLRTMAAANALVLLPDGDGAGAGDPVELWLLAVPQ